MKNPAALALAAALAAPAFAQSSISGSWYNPAQSGHGLAIDQLAPDSALLLWFSYDETGRPMPLYAEAARQGAEFSGPAYRPTGPRFGDWDPAALQFAPWGTLAFRAQDCETGELRWDAGGSFGSGATPMRLLAYTAGTACPHAARPVSALGGLSGTWYHPQLQGASVNVQVIDDASALAYWYTYDDAGQPKPLYVQGGFVGTRLDGDALAPHGLRFGEFRREDLVVDDFGVVSIDFHDCNHATLSYNTPLGFGGLPLVRLTQLDGVGCTLPDALPAADLPRHWVGIHHSLGDIPIQAMMTSRDELLLHMDGKVRRGFFAREGTELLLRFDDGTRTFGLRYDAATRQLQGVVGPGVTFRDIELHEIASEFVTTTLAQALPGTWGAWGAPAANNPRVQIAADLTLTLAQAPHERATGRIRNLDTARGTFDFELRYQPFGEQPSSHRIIGSGRIVRVFNAGQVLGEYLELFGAGPAGRSLYVSAWR